MFNKKHNLKSERSKDKKNGFQRENKAGNPQNENGLMKKSLQLNIFMSFLS